MSDAPEWVDPDAPPTEAPRPPSEREELIAAVINGNRLMTELIASLSQKLLRLDEIGAPVTRSRTRINKVDEARTDWWAHFEYDVIKANTKGTKDQQARAERYELS